MGNETAMLDLEASRKAHAKFDEAEKSRKRGHSSMASIQYRHSAKFFEGIDWHMMMLSLSWIKHMEMRGWIDAE